MSKSPFARSLRYNAGIKNPASLVRCLNKIEALHSTVFLSPHTIGRQTAIMLPEEVWLGFLVAISISVKSSNCFTVFRYLLSDKLSNLVLEHVLIVQTGIFSTISSIKLGNCLDWDASKMIFFVTDSTSFSLNEIC